MKMTILAEFLKRGRYWLLAVFSALLPVTGLADDTNYWHFTNSSSYLLSDSSLIGIDPSTRPFDPSFGSAVTGTVQLILQAQSQYRNTMLEYTGSMRRTYVPVGPKWSIGLTSSAGLYASRGIYTSRVFDNGGAGNSWRGLSARISNPDMTTYEPEARLKIFCLAGGSWLEYVSGAPVTLSGAPTFGWDDEAQSYVAQFNGANYVTLPDAQLLHGATGCTIACWVKLRAYTTWGGFVCARDGGGSKFILLNQSPSKTVTFQSNPSSVASTQILDLNRLYFIAATWRNSDGLTALYIDGQVSITSTGGVGGALQQLDNFRVPYDTWQSTWRSAADVHNVMIYNRALSANEIFEMYNKYPKAIKFQLRSGSSADPSTWSSTFVGPDGTTNTYYQPNQDVVDSANMSVSNRYAQYRAVLNSSLSRDRSPYLESLSLIDRNYVPYFDAALADFRAGDFTANVTDITTVLDTPYLGLAKNVNGGYNPAGTYTSRVLDGGTNVNWFTISWDSGGSALGNSLFGLAGLWHMDGTWGPASGSLWGSSSNMTFSSTSKLGRASAAFDGASSHVTFNVATNLMSLEFWFEAGRPDDGLLTLVSTGGAPTYLTITNGRINVAAPANMMPQVFLNGRKNISSLLSGWNHLVMVFDSPLYVDTIDLGLAGGRYFLGYADELAVYKKQLSPAEITEHFVSGRRPVAGMVRAQYRYGNSLPLTNAFNGTYIQSGGSIGITARYLQYRLFLEGDGQGTPAVNSVSVDIGTTIVDDTFAKFAQGTFDGGQTVWYGDQMLLEDLAGRGPVGQGVAGSPSSVWHMDETSWPATDTIIDSISARHGSPSGNAKPVILSTVGSHCGQFDGTNSYVAMPTPVLSADFTVSFWFKSRATAHSVIASSEPLSGNNYFTFGLNTNVSAAVTGALYFAINDGAVTRTVVSRKTNLNDNRWHSVLGVRKGAQMCLYVDGEREQAVNIGMMGSIGNNSMYIGRRGANPDSYYAGYADEVAIWTRALTDGEIGNAMASGWRSGAGATVTSDILDNGTPAIWQTLFWVTDGPYGNHLSTSDSSLAGLWTMEEGAPSAVISNAVSLINGTINGAAWSTAGRIGGCLSFNGTSAYVSFADSANLRPASISVEAWVNPTDATGPLTIVDKSSGAAGYRLGIDAGGKPYFWIGGPAGGTNLTGTLAVKAGKWSHLAGSFDGSVVNLYLDGALVLSGGYLANTAAAVPSYIGCRGGSTEFFPGLIDEVAIHNRALNNEEMMDHYRAGAATLKFQARVSSDTNLITSLNFTGPGGSTGTFFTVSSGDDLVGDLPLGRYFQFKAYMDTEDPNITPRLYSVKAFISSYPNNAPTVEPVAAAGFPFLGNILSFNERISTNANTYVEYQISGDPGVSNRWYYWGGTQWVQEAGSGYPANTSSRSTVNTHIGTFYDQLYAKTGGVLRAKVFLKSNGDQQAAADYVSVVASSGRLVVSAPNGTENNETAWISGVPYDIQWTWAGSVGANVAIDFSTNGPAGPWASVVASTPRGAAGTGSYTWTTPNADLLTNCFIRIRDVTDASIGDTSDGAFSITRKFKLVTPNGGETWYLGMTNNIVWESATLMAASLVQLHYAADASNYAYQIAFATLNTEGFKTNSFAWAIPANGTNLLSQAARIRVQKPNGDYADTSDGTFKIAGAVITSPTPGRKVKRSTPFTITWQSAAAGPAVAIDFSYDAGATFTNVLVASTPNVDGTNSYVWNVTQSGTDLAMLRLRSLSDPNVVAYSPVFTLADVAITAPVGGEIWLMNTTNTISWISGGAGALVNIYYSTNSGALWAPVQLGTTNSGSFVWTIPTDVSRKARIKVESVDDTNLWSTSAADFNIAGVRVVYPNLATDGLIKGTSYWMLHDAAPLSWQGARLEISYDQGTTYTPFSILSTNWNLGDPYQFIPDYPSSKTKVRVTVNNSSPFTNVFDESDEFFTVAGLLIQSPTNSMVFNIGASHQVKWVSAGADTRAYIYYSNLGTNNFVNLTPSGVGNNQVWPALNSWDWSISPSLIPSANARIKIQSGSFSEISDPFTLRGIRITSPTTGTVWNAGSSQVITWKAAGIDSSARGSLALSLNGGADAYPYLLTNTYGVVDFDFYLWDIDPNLDPSTNAVVKMKVESSSVAIDTNVYAYSDPFTLKGIKIISPALGNNWQLGTTNSITFIAAAAGSTATIRYSPDGGLTYETLPVASSLPIVDGSNTFSWVIESSREPSTNAVISVEGTTASAVSRRFTVGGVKVVRPMQYDIWAVGETNTIRWVSVGTAGINTLDLIREDASVFNITNNYAGTTLDWLALPGAIRAGFTTESNIVLRVRDSGGYEGYSEPFKLVSQPRIEMLSPLAGEYWKVGTIKEVRWLKGGQMQASNFRVFFSRDNFATAPQEITTPITFNSTNNVFSQFWSIPDQLGTTKIMVTNTVNPSVVAYSENFDVVGNFNVIFPNGNPADNLYALKPENASWSTVGSVTQVDLYYKYSTNNWTKINSTPAVNHGNGLSLAYDSYAWTLPNLQSTTVRFRVQDSNYTNIFDGVTPGPYDDSDSTFEIKYYTVYWDVYHVLNGVTNRLDQLSVVDSSGWSQSSLSCLDGSGQPQLLLKKYPYGSYDTAWYRQYFNNLVDFRWVCNSNQTRSVRMFQSTIEPEAHVLANFSYDISNRAFTVNSWLERNGAILSDPASCVISIYTSDGTMIEQFSSSTHDVNGVFWQVWNVNSTETRLGRVFTVNDTFFARIAINYSGSIYSSGLTIALRMAAGEEAVQAMQAIVSAATSNILASVSSINTNINAFHAETTAGISNLTRMGTVTTNMLSSVSTNMASLTNALLPGIDFLTNQISIIGPSLTNLSASVSNMNESTSARILTRPTSVSFGSTNTILYRTRPGYASSVVTVRVESVAHAVLETRPMVEVVSGIYQRELIATWGTDSYIISCGDPSASDSILLTVTAGGTIDGLPGQVATLDSKISTIGSQLDSVQSALSGLKATDLSSVMTRLSDIQATIQNSGNNAGITTALDGIQAQIGSLATASASRNQTFMDRLTGISSQLNSVGNSASDASKKAQSAKTQANAAASGIEGVKAALAAGDMKGAISRIDDIKGALTAASNEINLLPKVIKVDELYGSIKDMATSIENLARSKGFEYPIKLEKLPASASAAGIGFGPGAEGKPGAAGQGADEASLAILNKNMEEVKGSMSFMQKLLDEVRYEPVVQEELRGE